MPKVSVIIPVYNVEKYIGRCLDSVLSQSLGRIEVIVVNDCTLDNSMNIVKQYSQNDERLRILEHDVNHGPMIARWTGYMAACGDFITFVDGDDALAEGALEALYLAAIKENADIVSGVIRYVPNKGSGYLWKNKLRYGTDKVSVYKSMLKDECGHNLCSRLFRRELLQNYPYNIFECATNGEDGMLFYQVVDNLEKMVAIDTVVYEYYQNMESSSNVRLSERALCNIAKGNSIRIETAGKYPQLEKLILKKVSKVLFTLKINGYKIDKAVSENGLGYYCKPLTLFKAQGFAGCAFLYSKLVYHRLRKQIQSIKNKLSNMASISKGISYLLHDRSHFCDSIVKNYLGWLPDKLYLSLRYRFIIGHWIDWKNPKTFTEKIQWLKVYNRKPEYTTMVDKYAVKRYVADRIGEDYVIPTIGVWEKTEDIDWDSLPNQFVLKTTHGGGGGGVVICRDKSIFNRQMAVAKLNESLASDIYSNLREWPYKNVYRRIIAEKFIASCKSSTAKDLPDYKFFCFNGEPKYCQVIRDRHTKETIDFYDMQWNHQDFVGLNPVASNGLNPVARPKHLDEMVAICRKLSADIPFVRVDLYVVDDKEYFGELTFFPASGLGWWTPEDADEKIGSYLNIRTI